MKNIFKLGDCQTHHFEVKEADFASFKVGTVHRVCSTFALGREMEWSSRLFVLEMIESNEEGVGTFLNIKHHGPAFLGERLTVKAIFDSLEHHELICKIEVSIGERLIATGMTGQKILTKDKINQIFTSLER